VLCLCTWYWGMQPCGYIRPVFLALLGGGFLRPKGRGCGMGITQGDGGSWLSFSFWNIILYGNVIKVSGIIPKNHSGQGFGLFYETLSGFVQTALFICW